MLAIAIVLITGALVLYSTGVWAERIGGRLRWWHAATFVAGLVCDASGTWVMKGIAESGGGRSGGVAGQLSVVMAWTGGLALLLMAAHAAWAIVVLLRGRENELVGFHRFSLGVWGLWLVPYVAGMASAMI